VHARRTGRTGLSAFTTPAPRVQRLPIPPAERNHRDQLPMRAPPFRSGSARLLPPSASKTSSASTSSDLALAGNPVLRKADVAARADSAWMRSC
jgi:hypothetical protein